MNILKSIGYLIVLEFIIHPYNRLREIQYSLYSDLKNRTCKSIEHRALVGHSLNDTLPRPL